MKAHDDAFHADTTMFALWKANESNKHRELKKKNIEKLLRSNWIKECSLAYHSNGMSKSIL